MTTSRGLIFLSAANVCVFAINQGAWLCAGAAVLCFGVGICAAIEGD